MCISKGEISSEKIGSSSCVITNDFLSNEGHGQWLQISFHSGAEIFKGQAPKRKGDLTVTYLKYKRLIRPLRIISGMQSTIERET